jgi:hemerythrin-like domain-containing protein
MLKTNPFSRNIKVDRAKPALNKDIPQPEAKVEGNIISAIKGEHKYTLMLISVLHEQLSEYDIGKTPDYNLMYDLMTYMADFPYKFNQALKIKFISTVINKSPENSQDLENLLAEKRQITDFNKQVVMSLKSIIKSYSILKEEEFKIFAKNYVELIESHIDIEQKVLFVRAENLLSVDEIAEFDKPERKDIQHIFDQDIAPLLEGKYKDLAEDINQRWADIENAANDFALAEFISLGALFESIEPLALSASEISAIIKDCSYTMFMANRTCYKDLMFNQQKLSSDYLEKPISTALDCYEEYVSSMSKIGVVLKNAKAQIYEPYESRKDLYSAGNFSDSTSESVK